VPPSLIEIVQQTDLTIQGQVVDTSTNQPVDITGCTLELAVWQTAEDPGPPLLLKTTQPGGGITFITPTSGILDIAFAEADTANLVGDYAYEITRTDPGNRRRLEYGLFRVFKTLTP